ncbi:protein-export chaperone SecB [Desulfolutivibrio sulfoxidireducens]|uniref:protein-export chaperone SecB n=1 Tax=Desulfolutivibrio sulfoxidireducens TaxID=2773299 RepID=UPI00159D9B5C|nr:protein-export chaperone SecB [Desulfolutivibrio sulfoxidireducens]QLA17567.1 hypothetical protein GD605_16510 [Desulfolutivibrio sulfoxidireducens]
MEVQDTKKPPIELLNHFFSEISVLADPLAASKEENEAEFGYDYSLNTEIGQNPEDDSLYIVILTIKSKELDNYIKGYDIKLSIVGYFKVSQSYPQDKRSAMVSVLGPSLLYGAAREFLYSLTLRGPYPPIYLPTTSFIPENTKIKKEVLEEKSPGKTPSKKKGKSSKENTH